MEWGGGNHGFVFELQAKVFTEPDHFISNFTHPLILAGFAGQLILIVGILWPGWSRWWLIGAIYVLAIPLFFIALAGVFSFNWKMVLSPLPYLVFGSISLYRLHTAKM